jgi:hypothetical protein
MKIMTRMAMAPVSIGWYSAISLVPSAMRVKIVVPMSGPMNRLLPPTTM